jgi:agmatinase
MSDLQHYDPNSIGNPNNNIFGLPTAEEDSQLIIVPVPWEVTVSFAAGTARCAQSIQDASMQVDLYDADYPGEWRKGIYMREVDKKVLLKSDYLRKEAELYISFISEEEDLEQNQFMCKTLREVNEGSVFMNNWVYEQTSELLAKGKLVDAHCDLRKAYEDFNYSHASIMYNALEEVPQLTRLVQVGIRDYCDEEWDYIRNSNFRVVSYFDKDIKERMFEGQTWKMIANDIVDHLPQKVYISFDIDGLDPKLCPNTGTPVMGGLETEQVFYIFKQIIKSGRQIIAFDLNEVGVGENGWDANVGARVLYKLCNLLLHANS